MRTTDERLAAAKRRAFAYLIAKQPRIRDGGFRAYLYQSARQPVLR